MHAIQQQQQQTWSAASVVPALMPASQQLEQNRLATNDTLQASWPPVRTVCNRYTETHSGDRGAPVALLLRRMPPSYLTSAGLRARLLSQRPPRLRKHPCPSFCCGSVFRLLPEQWMAGRSAAMAAAAPSTAANPEMSRDAPHESSRSHVPTQYKAGETAYGSSLTSLTS
jgi:hypothetical protein